MQEEKFDYERFQQEAIQGLYEGKPLTGENGVFAPLLKHFLEKALEGEFNAYMLEEKAKDHPTRNRKNGKSSKQVKSLSGEFDLQTPRDREGSFDPKIVAKRQVVITEGLEQKVIALYAMGHRGAAIVSETYLPTSKRFMVWNYLPLNSLRLLIKSSLP